MASLDSRLLVAEVSIGDDFRTKIETEILIPIKAGNLIDEVVYPILIDELSTYRVYMIQHEDERNGYSVSFSDDSCGTATVYVKGPEMSPEDEKEKKNECCQKILVEALSEAARNAEFRIQIK